MANLISPNVSVSIIDESFYVAGRQTTVPLFFIATQDEKVQVDGVTPAMGTYESGVVRVVTSIKQALELYGVPKYLYSADGTPHHGDARNEYGLDGLLKFLELGNRAYVVRANVNLNDSYADIKAMWTRKISAAAALLEELVDDYIDAYNAANELYSPTQTGYKTAVTKAELSELVDEVLVDVFSSSSFSSDLFALNFTRDHTVAHAGFQDVVFETFGGFIQASDITGFEADETYEAVIDVVSQAGTNTYTVSVLGSAAVTFGDLIAELNTAFGGEALAEIIAGRIRITSNLVGATSSVNIASDGGSGVGSLFGNAALFQYIADPIDGTGPSPLVVYDDSFATAIGTYDGLEAEIDAFVGDFSATDASSLLIAAAADYDNTQEFRSETSLGANDSTRRAKIVQALSAAVNNPSSGIRAENLEYNVTIAPGFPELADELLRLSEDMLQEVFVIGETPFDKPPTGPNGVNNWARTTARASSPNIAYAYPHGISTNIDGRRILTTAGSSLLRVFAFNDSEADLWWAPAGTARGRCTHLETIGYVTGALGGPTTFVTDYIDLGTRDELYEFPKNINPITFIPGRGILVMGQKTTSPTSSALDRINVSRLIMFIRRELRKAMFAFLFEPNDRLTREEVKFTADGFLGGLINRRALYDFASLCDTTNNTPERIDANELWLDVVIQPVKAVEFIYIPIRVANTGANIG